MSSFRISYDGPALAGHQMNVHDLAPALLAVGDLLEAATRVLNGERLKAQTSVRASFQTGSFSIDFNLATDWVLKVRDLFASDGATATANALAILAALGLVARKSGSGLLAALKWLRGRAIERVEPTDTGMRLIVDRDSLEIEREVLALLRELDVREAIDRMLAPLDRDGVTRFAAGGDDAIASTIEASEREWFSAPRVEDELILDEARKMAFSIVSLAFKEDNKWRLYDGAATLHAVILDTDFLARVDQDLERFAKGDLLICRVRVRQWQTRSGARTEYEVIEVLEHRQAGRQIPLPL